jgi:ATP-dependent DNA helicase RecG
MKEEQIKKLVAEVQSMETEWNTLELKAAEKGCPQRIFDTLSSFSNQDEGGVILFGVDEKDYSVCGVYDAADLQKRVNAKCLEMEPVVRPNLSVARIEDKNVVAAQIPGRDYTERPVFYKGKGIHKGSYVRCGDSDEPMTEFEIYKYESYRKGTKEDRRSIEEGFVMKDEALLRKYLERVRTSRTSLFTEMQDPELMELMSVTNCGNPTLAGTMIFSRYPQKTLPGLCVTAVVIPGTERGVSQENGTRFLDNERVEGNIPSMLEQSVNFIMRNCRQRTVINSQGQRADMPEYPLVAVREAVLNALIHRDYSVYTESKPVRIEMFADRMEITSAGGIYGRTPVEKLGYDSPETRNSTITRILETLHISENRFSGIPTIRQEMKKASLPEPVFKDDGKEFKTIFYNDLSLQAASETAAHRQNFQKETDPARKKVIDFCRTPKSRAEIAEFLGCRADYAAKAFIKPLIEDQLLFMTLPQTPKSKYQKYCSSFAKE